MKTSRPLLLLVMACLIAACSLHKRASDGTVLPSTKVVHTWLVDANATRETAALFYNLKKSAQNQVLFGHMEDNKNGYGGWTDIPGRSDVFEVAGSYPEVYGFDFGPIATWRTGNYTDKETRVTHDRVVEAYKRNGVVTFSWHYNNPVSKGSFYWKDSPVNAVSEILPNGNYNQVFKQSLKKVAAFAASVTYKDKLVPIIFRPFHEFDGDWFWWGKAHCTAEDYKALYRYTVTYLRDSLHVRNFLYAFSPDCNFNSVEKYTERYPGDAYVDILGMDDYYDLRTGQTATLGASKLKIISDMAQQRNKVAAFTETGLENLPQRDWYTQTLLKVLKADHTNIAYVLVWSNRPKSYWTPYKGHPAEADFIAFTKDPYVRLADSTKTFYKIK